MRFLLAKTGVLIATISLVFSGCESNSVNGYFTSLGGNSASTSGTSGSSSGSLPNSNPSPSGQPNPLTSSAPAPTPSASPSGVTVGSPNPNQSATPGPTPSASSSGVTVGSPNPGQSTKPSPTPSPSASGVTVGSPNPTQSATPSPTPSATATQPSQPIASPTTSPTSSPLPSPTISPPPGITKTLTIVQPALAVRGIGCLMCHARANSDIITDFGYGDPFFAGKDLPTFEAQYYYGNHFLGWQDHPAQSATDADYTVDSSGNQPFIKGTVNVPQIQIGQNQGQPVALKDFLVAPDANDNAVIPDTNNANVTDAHEAWVNTRKFQPPSGVYVQDWKTVHIGDLTSAQILALDPSLANLGNAQWKRISGANDPASANKPAVAGLATITNSSGSYVSNVAGTSFTCYGDIVVNGSLYLQDATIVTDDGGCRLYVTQSVFVRGGINITGTGKSGFQNLQITSARAIVMGMSATTFANRFNASHDSTDGSGLVLHNYPDSTSALGLVSQITDEMNTIGSSNLLDAEDPGSIAEYGSAAGMGSTASSINYSHILVNAPLVESRYLGQFKGSVIAEIAMFALGDLNFSYDPVFSQVYAFPLVPDTTAILNVTN